MRNKESFSYIIKEYMILMAGGTLMLSLCIFCIFVLISPILLSFYMNELGLNDFLTFFSMIINYGILFTIMRKLGYVDPILKDIS